MCSQQPSYIIGGQRIYIDLKDITYIYVCGHGGERGGSDLALAPSIDTRSDLRQFLDCEKDCY